MDRLASLEAFARVAETKSFTAAAKRLNISKSLVSRQVAALESELGLRLFQRTTRALTLTEAGRNYYPSVARILADLEEARLSVTQLQTAPRGLLRVNAPVSFATAHLTPAVPDFLSLFPEVEIELTLNDRYVDLVEEGYDVAIRVGHLVDSSLVARRLAPARRAVAASPAYLAEAGTPETPDDVVHHQCLRYSLLDPAQEWRFVGPGNRPWPVEVRGRMRSNNADALRGAALKGLGLVSLPTFIIGGDLQAGTLVSVLTAFTPQDSGIHAVYPHSRHLSPKTRAFVDFLAERFGPRPHWDLVE
jgi:DNA-binding transcriptional LysR family regulator